MKSAWDWLAEAGQDDRSRRNAERFDERDILEIQIDALKEARSVIRRLEDEGLRFTQVRMSHYDLVKLESPRPSESIDDLIVRLEAMAPQ
jgi:hypothetical protein